MISALSQLFAQIVKFVTEEFYALLDYVMNFLVLNGGNLVQTAISILGVEVGQFINGIGDWWDNFPVFQLVAYLLPVREIAFIFINAMALKLHIRSIRWLMAALPRVFTGLS